MTRFISFLLVLLLFIGPVVLSVMGCPVEGEGDGKIILYPAYYILVIYLPIAYLWGGINIRDCKFALVILITIVVFYIGYKFTNRPIGRMIFFNCMALPAMYYIFFQSLDSDEIMRHAKNALLSSFVLNCLIAIYERINHILFFPYDMIRSDIAMIDTTDMTTFRSTALLGYPLTNALITSIIMVFILTSSFKSNVKWPLYFMGLFSLFCFNARASIMFSLGTLLLLIFRNIFSGRISLFRKCFSIFLLIFVFFFVDYLLNEGYGGRFFSNGPFSSDDSVLSRFNVWEVLYNNNISTFLWGLSSKEVEVLVLTATNTFHVENWFILSSLYVGFVLTLIIVFLYIPLFAKALKNYSTFSSFLILIIVIGLSSTNNSLACGVPALSTFFVCCFAFSEYSPHKILNLTKTFKSDERE